MAILLGNLLSGSIGPYVFRIVNGKQVVSLKPAAGEIKQSAATKRVNKFFGDAATLGAHIRKTLAGEYPKLFKIDAINQISARLIKCLKSGYDPVEGKYEFTEDRFDPMVGLEFNKRSQVKNLVNVWHKIELHGNILRVNMSEIYVQQDVKFPRDSVRCEIVVALSLFRLHDGKMVEVAERQSISFNFNQIIIKPFAFDFDVPPGCLCLVSMFLNYSSNSNSAWYTYRDHITSPGCFCGAVVTPGKYQNNDRRKWIKSIKLK